MSKKLKIIPTSKEHTLNENDFIVTKTDLKGQITYANEVFLDLCSFKEQDIMGQPHNIIRHPDMPKAVFKLLWETLKKQDEFFGVVKNICSDGSFYWVLANITPSFDANGKVIGYFSVRRKPKKELIAIISKLYQQMLKVENSHTDKKQAIEASMQVLTNFIDEQGVSYNEYLISFA